MPRNLGNLDNIPILPSLPASPQAGDICMVSDMPFLSRVGGWGAFNNIVYPYSMFAWMPRATTTTNSGLGILWVIAGTATAYTPSSTSRVANIPVLEALVSTASTTAVAGYRSGWIPVSRERGFIFAHIWRTGTGQTIATHRAFVGLRPNTSAPTDVNPSTQVDIIGMGWDSGDGEVSIMVNDANGIATKIPLGTDFPRPTANRADAYYMELMAFPGDNNVYYRIINIANNAIATGSVNTDIPDPTRLLGIYAYASVGGTSSVIGIGAGATQVLAGV